MQLSDKSFGNRRRLILFEIFFLNPRKILKSFSFLRFPGGFSVANDIDHVIFYGITSTVHGIYFIRREYSCISIKPLVYWSVSLKMEP